MTFSAIGRWVEVTELYNLLRSGVYVTAGVKRIPWQLTRRINEQGSYFIKFSSLKKQNKTKTPSRKLFKVTVKLCNDLNLLWYISYQPGVPGIQKIYIMIYCAVNESWDLLKSWRDIPQDTGWEDRVKTDLGAGLLPPLPTEVRQCQRRISCSPGPTKWQRRRNAIAPLFRRTWENGIWGFWYNSPWFSKKPR